MLVRVFASEHFVQNPTWILGAHDGIEFVRQCNGPCELEVASIAVAKAQRPFARDIAQQNVRLAKDGHGVKEIERSWLGEIALHHVPRQAPMLAPLDVDSNLGLRPRRVQYRAMPVGSEVSWRVSRIVAYP